jgi:hypothetical protein
MSVAQKIISGNEQPNGGRGVVSVGGMRGLGSSSDLLTQVASTNILHPPFNQENIIDQSIASINAVLDTRFDEINYYYNSGAY